ncbi:MAG: GNAT family N-acetyltransferase [Anaerolineales bacterium]|nr:GNAT family N-acetyltransferase [Anaerolineales bacterium]
MESALTILPANQASWDDLIAILGPARCHGKPCYCQRFKIHERNWRLVGDEERADRLRAQTHCSDAQASQTSGLVAYLGDEPVGWCAVEPRPVYENLMLRKWLWVGREDEDENDESVWAVTCFIVRNGYRRRGFTYALALAAVDFARQRGARALEAYSMITHPGKTITWGELHVGSYNIFEEAGFRKISQPSKRRIIMRIDF